VLVDAAQAAPHLPLDVRDLGCDFLALSGHKVYGPTGIGVLYGRAELLEKMVPYQGGGEMILSVTFDKTIYAKIPHKFEAGTPDIAGVVGLGAALDYVTAAGLDAIGAHERDLLDYATGIVSGVEGLRIVGTAREKAGVISFVLGHRPRLVRPLQHPRGDGRPGGGASQGKRGVQAMMDPVNPNDMGGLDELYQEVILDHYKKPRNSGTLEPPCCSAQGFNPLCGDRLTLQVRLDGDTIADLRFTGDGCAISVASASLMTESIKGMSRAEAEKLFERFHAMVTGESGGGLGKLDAFAGVSDFPVRVKCASLAWHTLRAALEGRTEPVSTE
jgi:SUF system NifU family Fe-S assembly protein